MAKKVDIELVKLILKRNDLDTRQVFQIIEDIQNEVDAQDLDEEKPPPVKKQFVMMISDPQGDFEGKDLTGWVLQIPEDESPYTAEEKLFQSVYEYNTTPKGRRLMLKSVSEACEIVPARIHKEQSVWVKTKEPVLAVFTKNQVPTEESDPLKPQLN